jgi:hypothetical protein
MKGRSLFERNADACERAVNPKCVCACGGKLHGAAHSQAWREATWRDLEAQVQPSPASRTWHGVGPATGGPGDRIILTPIGEALLQGLSLDRVRELAHQAMSAEELTGDLFADLEAQWLCMRCGLPLTRAELIDGETCPHCLLVQ